MGEGRYPVTFGTFHAVFFCTQKCLSLLLPKYHQRREKVSDLYDIIHRMELEYEDEQEFMSGVLSEIVW